LYTVDRFGPVVRIRMATTLLGRPLLWVNAFWVDGLLIDSGCAHTVPDLMAALDREGLMVEQLVHTHTHEDHVAGDGELMRRYKVIPRVHGTGLDLLRYGEPDLPLYRRLTWGNVKGCRGGALTDSVETERHRLSVIHTPGHAPDHVAFLEEREGWLFSGDLLVSPRLVRVRPPEDPVETIASMRRAAALPFRHLFCSHARQVHDGPEPLQAKIARWEYLQEEAARLADRGEGESEITRRLLGPDGLIEYLSRGDLSKRNLVHGLLQGGMHHRPA